jgi:hypothetical protein
MGIHPSTRQASSDACRRQQVCHSTTGVDSALLKAYINPFEYSTVGSSRRKQMSYFGETECDAHGGLDGDTLHLPIVGIHSGGDVDREDWTGAIVDGLNDPSLGCPRRALQTGTEEGIDNDIAAPQSLDCSACFCRQRKRLHPLALEPLQQLSSLSLDGRGLDTNVGVDGNPVLGQKSSDDESVATVVTLAAYDSDPQAFESPPSCLQRFYHPGAGSLHQHGGAEGAILDGLTVYRRHLPPGDEVGKRYHACHGRSRSRKPRESRTTALPP